MAGRSGLLSRRTRHVRRRLRGLIRSRPVLLGLCFGPLGLRSLRGRRCLLAGRAVRRFLSLRAFAVRGALMVVQRDGGPGLETVLAGGDDPLARGETGFHDGSPFRRRAHRQGAHLDRVVGLDDEGIEALGTALDGVVGHGHDEP